MLGQEKAQFVYNATPLFCRTDLADVYVVDVLSVFTEEEIKTYQKVINEHLVSYEMELLIKNKSDWRLRSARKLDFQVEKPSALIGKSLSSFFPIGLDRGFLLKIMTELQMILHEATPNIERLRRHQETFDVLWIWQKKSWWRFW